MVGDLPAMPAVVSEVLRITEDPKVDMQVVGRVIESDPAMAGKILKVSNSSYYGMKQFVGTLKMALVILGVREVRNIVLGISVFEAIGHAVASFADYRLAPRLDAPATPERVLMAVGRLRGEAGP